MKRFSIVITWVAAVAASTALAHDPRTVAKDFSHGLKIEGAGTLSLSYKSLHFNEGVYKRMQGDEAFRERMNAGMWSNIGSLEAGFETVMGTQKLAKGTYTLGLSFGPSDSFALTLKGAGGTVTVPMKSTSDNPELPYLTFSIAPTDKPDTFTLEGRGGRFRAVAEMKVPFLGEHAHPGPHK